MPAAVCSTRLALCVQVTIQQQAGALNLSSLACTVVTAVDTSNPTAPNKMFAIQYTAINSRGLSAVPLTRVVVVQALCVLISKPQHSSFPLCSACARTLCHPPFRHVLSCLLLAGH
jgi:hypothetical protein